MKKQERKRLLKLYGSLYRRVGLFDWTKCAYCRYPRQCYDHVPPLTVVESLDVKGYLEKGGRFRLYPSCLQCNKYLGPFELTDYLERLLHLSTMYNNRLEKLGELWTENEIKALGKTLRTHIETQKNQQQVINEKLAALDENYLNDDYSQLL